MDPPDGPASLELGWLKGAVDEEESEGCRLNFRAGDEERGVMSVEGNVVGTASAMDGDNGSITFFSLIEMTIFSSPKDVMCFSRPLLLVKLSIDDFLGEVRGEMSSGNTCGG